MRNRFIANTLNSSVVGVSVFIILGWINQIVIHLAMLSGSVMPVFGWDILSSKINSWALSTILITYGANFYLNLAIFILSLIFYEKNRRKNTLLKLYYVWAMLISYSWLLHYIFSGFMLNSKFYLFASWVHLGNDFLFVLSVVSVLIVFFTSQIFTYPFLVNSSTKKDSENWMRTLVFLFLNVLIPSMFIVFFSYLFKNTEFVDSFYFANLFLCGVVIIIMFKLILLKPKLNKLKAQKNSVFDRISVGSLILFGILTLSVVVTRYDVL
jgi:hypothetical protein